MRKFLICLSILAFFVTQTAFAKDYSVHKLSNGQTLIIKEVHENPIVTIDTWIKTGSVNETEENAGVAHFLEHMFFKGTQKHPVGEFDQILESKGANTNAATSRDYTHYYIEIPSKYFNLAMELHSDMLLNPMLPRNELEMERKVVLEEMARGNDNPDSILFKKMNENLYSNHPYKREVIGYEKVIETIPREKMLEFYQKWYTPKNMITVVVGDITTSEVIKNVEENFKSEDKTKLKNVKYKKDNIKTDIPFSVTNDDTQTGYLLIGFRGVEPKNKKDSAALDVLATILGGSQSSRLYQNIQENKHLTTSITSGHASYKQDSLFYIKAKFQPKNQATVEGEIWNELNRILNSPVSDNELKIAKNIIERETLYSRESVSNIANELGYITALTDNPSSYDSYINDIKKVKAKDVLKVSNKYLLKKYASVAYILPKGQNLKPAETSDNTPKKTSDITEKKLISKNYPTANAKLISENKNTKKFQLDNGLTLIITKNKSNKIISLNILSKGGYIQENEIKKGAGTLTSDLLLKGTKNLTSAEISSILDENGIEIASQILPDAFSTSIKTTENEFNTALDLFDEIINNSNLSETDLENVKNKRLQQIKTSRDIPSNLAFDEMKHLLWEGTPYQRSSKILEKAYEKVNINDIKTFYSNIYYPKNTIVSVNGNVDEQTLINYFSKVFENKNSKIFDLYSYQPQIHPIIKDKTSVTRKDTNQAWVLLAYRTPPISNYKDWAALKVIDSILGTGMSSRLFTELRDRQGLAYTVASIYQSNALQGVFLTYIGTNPKTADKSKEEMLAQIEKIKRTFVSSDELTQAKERILGNYILAQETNSEKAHTLSGFELDGRGYDFEKKYFDLINSVTEQDIITTANKYFNKPQVLVIVK